METNKRTAAGAEGVSTAERSGLLGAKAPGAGDGSGQSLPRRSSGDSKTKKQPASKPKRPQRSRAMRALLWTLRASVVPALLIIALIGGLYVGYAVLGKRPGEGVFEWETWKHMYDLVFAES